MVDLDRNVSADTRFMVAGRGELEVATEKEKAADAERPEGTRGGQRGPWQNVAVYERNARYKYAVHRRPSCVGG